MSRELTIWMDGELVGHLVDRGRADMAIIYDPGHAASGRSTPLSLSLPLSDGEHRTPSVTNYLWGLLPEDREVIGRWAREHDTRPTDLFGLIEAVGADVPGAAVYLPPEEVPDGPGHHAPVGEDEVAGILARLRADRATWHSPRHRERWSLAGAQAKIALAHHPEIGWTVPTGTAPTTHILKPAIAGFADQDLNEVICLRAGRALGLRTARTEIASFGDERAIVSTRYDRTVEPNGLVRRIHQEDFCQALGVHPADKYQSDGGPTAAHGFDLLYDHSTDARADMALLRDALAYNWLILGTDAHAKNYSLVLRGQQVRLAPLYDIASLAPHVRYPPKAKLAQKVGGAYVAGRIGERNWERLAKEARLDPDETVHRVRRLAEQVPDAIRDAAVSLDLRGDERGAATAVAGSITSWADRCRSTIGPSRMPPDPASPQIENRPQQGRSPKGTASGGQFLTTRYSEPDSDVADEDG